MLEPPGCGWRRLFGADGVAQPVGLAGSGRTRVADAVEVDGSAPSRNSSGALTWLHWRLQMASGGNGRRLKKHSPAASQEPGSEFADILSRVMTMQAVALPGAGRCTMVTIPATRALPYGRSGAGNGTRPPCCRRPGQSGRRRWQLPRPLRCAGAVEVQARCWHGRRQAPAVATVACFRQRSHHRAPRLQPAAVDRRDQGRRQGAATVGDIARRSRGRYGDEERRGRPGIRQGSLAARRLEAERAGAAPGQAGA